MSEYEKQANDFLQSTNATLKVEFLEHGKHFEDDKENRDIYNITLMRGGRKFTFKFGQSIAHSGEWLYTDVNPKFTKTFHDKIIASEYAGRINGNRFAIKKNPAKKVPTACDVLACLTKYDPGTFDNFCSEYGYDVDSRKAYKTYKAVMREWSNIERLFTVEQIEQLQEIQ